MVPTPYTLLFYITIVLERMASIPTMSSPCNINNLFHIQITREETKKTHFPKRKTKKKKSNRNQLTELNSSKTPARCVELESAKPAVDII